MQCSTTIQGLLLIIVNITLLLKMENNISRNILLAEQLASCSYLMLVGEAYCTFFFQYRAVVLQMQDKKCIRTLWGSSVGHVHHSFLRHWLTQQNRLSVSFLHLAVSEFKYSCTFASSNGLWTSNSLYCR